LEEEKIAILVKENNTKLWHKKQKVDEDQASSKITALTSCNGVVDSNKGTRKIYFGDSRSIQTRRYNWERKMQKLNTTRNI